MSRIYGPQNVALQERFGTRKLAERIESLACKTEFDSELWQNCPRYVHRYEKVRPSRYVPRAGEETPLAQWKRIDGVQDVLGEADAARARSAGTIGVEDWIQKIESGDPTA